MQIIDDPVFITPYFALKLYRVNPFKYDFEVEYKRKKFKINRITIFSFDLFRFMCCFYYTVYGQEYDYKSPLYVHSVYIYYKMKGRKYCKIFELENLSEFYEEYKSASFYRSIEDEFYRKLEGRYADRTDLDVYIFCIDGKGDNINYTRFCIVNTNKRVNLSSSELYDILYDLQDKTIFEYHAPRGIIVGYDYEYRDGSYAEIVRIR